jgi:DNA-directed RNA polymerase specialized sigma24 family protein
MRNTIVAPNHPARQSADTPPAVRAERKRKLMTITQDDYHELLANLTRIMRPGFCDPGDALNEALIVAMKKYDGNGSLKAFVTRAAWLYALEQYKKHAKRQITFSALTTDDELNEYLESVIAYTLDPRYVEGVDELFIQRIEQILYQMRDYRHRHTTTEAIADAKAILKLYRENANLGKGIGIDEYETAPEVFSRGKYGRAGRRAHSHTQVRHAIVTRLADELETTAKDIYSACKALRNATLQALHEGWLPA